MLPDQTEHSHFFTLRLWSQVDEDGLIQWRGKLHNINNDEVRYFQDWSALIPLLLAMLRASRASGLTMKAATSSQAIDELDGEANEGQ